MQNQNAMRLLMISKENSKKCAGTSPTISPSSVLPMQLYTASCTSEMRLAMHAIHTVDVCPSFPHSDQSRTRSTKLIVTSLRYSISWLTISKYSGSGKRER